MKIKSRKEWLEILHLPFWERICHVKAKRPRRAILLGFMVMGFGSTLGVYKDLFPLPHVLMDLFAYGIHGIGTIPIIKYAEPLWSIIMGIEE